MLHPATESALQKKGRPASLALCSSISASAPRDGCRFTLISIQHFKTNTPKPLVKLDATLASYRDGWEWISLQLCR